MACTSNDTRTRHSIDSLAESTIGNFDFELLRKQYFWQALFSKSASGVFSYSMRLSHISKIMSHWHLCVEAQAWGSGGAATPRKNYHLWVTEIGDGDIPKIYHRYTPHISWIYPRYITDISFLMCGLGLFDARLRPFCCAAYAFFMFGFGLCHVQLRSCSCAAQALFMCG